MFQLPPIVNEPIPAYAPGSPERQQLQAALDTLQKECPKVPLIINNEYIFTDTLSQQTNPSNHTHTVCQYATASPSHIKSAIEGALQARHQWDTLPFDQKSAIFLRAADLLSHKYRYEMMAAMMLGQGKNIQQAAIDCHAELCDFWRFNCLYAQDILQMQPKAHSDTVWNRTDYRGLEGFVYCISPFNFTAIGGNLPSAPAIMGNVCIWKPSDYAIYSNYLCMKILIEAGLPKGVIQFTPGPPAPISEQCLSHPSLVGMHFTGSTKIFKQLWSTIGQHMEHYKAYPRIVGETGGKNYHLVHPSAPVEPTKNQLIRAAFEFQGQKCSALSRAYLPSRDYLPTEALHCAPVTELDAFTTCVIHKDSFDRCSKYIEMAKKDASCEIVLGGHCDDSKGYFVQPTIIVCSDLSHPLFHEEIFGPVLTVYIYKDFDAILPKIAECDYGLTGAIFSRDRAPIVKAMDVLRQAQGNLYINDKCTGAVVGQQPFGGGRMSGTNDKAGASYNLMRWANVMSIKETLVDLEDYKYPSNK